MRHEIGGRDGGGKGGATELRLAMRTNRSCGGVHAGVSGWWLCFAGPGCQLHGQSAPPQSLHGAPCGHIDGSILGTQVGPAASPLVVPGPSFPGMGSALFLRKHEPSWWWVDAAQSDREPVGVGCSCVTIVTKLGSLGRRKAYLGHTRRVTRQLCSFFFFAATRRPPLRGKTPLAKYARVRCRVRPASSSKSRPFPI